MHVVMGATGQTGSVVVSRLLAAGVKVIAVVRAGRGEALAKQGAVLMVADAADPDQLARAFEGAEAIYVMNPPAYGSSNLFARAAQVHAASISAAAAVGAPRLVVLSSVGAQRSKGTGNILTTYDLEQRLADYHGLVTILRAANFMENWGAALVPARERGILPSMFLPLDVPLPMVSALDVGMVAAELMVEGGSGCRVVELHGPQDYSPIDVADTLSELLDRQVKAVGVEGVERAMVFERQGMPPVTVAAFVEMYDGFNQRITTFENTHDQRRGTTSLGDALKRLLDQQLSP